MPYTPMELAEAFLRTGELADALDALNQQLEAEPEDDQARRIRMAVLLQLGEDAHLRQALEDSQALVPLSTADLQRRSVILERLGDLAGALEALNEARQITPDDERLAERALHLLLALDRQAEARELVAAQSKNWRWLQWAGDLAAHAGEFDAAVGHYDAALAQIETQFDTQMDVYARALLARLLLARADSSWQAGQLDAAERDYLAAGEIIPDEPMVAFGRGLLAALRGDIEVAVVLCEDAFAVASDTLRDNLRDVLHDPRFQVLAARLNL